MRKLIGGKAYDPDTANKIAEKGGETLYRKRNGEFFLVAGEIFRPLSPKAARAWANDLPEVEREKIFSVPAGKVRLGLSISGEALEKLKEIAAARRISISEVVEELLL